MTSKGARAGAAARYLTGFALIACSGIIVVGIVTDSPYTTANGVALMLGVMLVVGATYAAVFAREAQLARREKSRRGQGRRLQ
jgi:hypothetical protein